MAGLTIQLPTQLEQTEFNVRRWEEVLEDPTLAKIVGRIETDRHGQIIMSPPPAPDHGENQFSIGHLLKLFLPKGKVLTECPISTADGVRLADVVWLSQERNAQARERALFRKAPEICVEVFSPANSRSEMEEKKALYFEAGAMEVWFCDRRQRMTFFLGPDSPGEKASRLCPEFPEQIDI